MSSWSHHPTNKASYSVSISGTGGNISFYGDHTRWFDDEEWSNLAPNLLKIESLVYEILGLANRVELLQDAARTLDAVYHYGYMESKPPKVIEDFTKLGEITFSQHAPVVPYYPE